MKYKLLAAFSVVLVILGVASLGAVLQDLSEQVRQDTYLGFTMAAGFLAGGAFLYWAARRRYSIGWRMYLGLFLVFFGFVGASIEADDMANERAEEPVFGFVLTCAFALSGFLLTRSGYWWNRRRMRAQPMQDEKGVPSPSRLHGAAQTLVRVSDEIAVGTGPEPHK